MRRWMMLTCHVAITSVREVYISSALRIHEFGRAYTRSIDSRSTVGMNRAAMWPPIPVVCPVEWPYRNKLSLKKKDTILTLTMNTRVDPVLLNGLIITFILDDATNPFRSARSP
jgi:hypothetical protein